MTDPCTISQAIGRAAIIRAGFNSIERRLLEANEAAALIAAHYGRNDVSVFSGGDADDKDQPPVQP